MSTPDDDYLLEVPLDVSFLNERWPVGFNVSHPSARLLAVEKRRDLRADGTTEREYGVLVVRDRGYAAHASIYRHVIMVRARTGATPIPREAGRLVGQFSTENGLSRWLVFEGRVAERAPASASRPESARRSASAPSAPRAPSSTERAVSRSSTSSGSAPPSESAAAPPRGGKEPPPFL